MFCAPYHFFSRHQLPAWYLFLAVVLTAPWIRAQEATTEDADSNRLEATADARAEHFFESRIRGILADKCYECHSVDSGLSEGGMRLDSRQAIRLGGSRGPVVVPGKPDASLLISAVEHLDIDLKMPPDAPKLSEDVIYDLRKWIEMGAFDPREETTDQVEKPWRVGDDFWSYQPPVRSTAPTVNDETWAKDPIDDFILEQLEKNNLSPTPDAQPHVFLRRLSYDLTGLPPSPESLEQFQVSWRKRGADSAIAAAVDRLLETPQFGERWGRHWLDVARFGESSGKEANISFPYAWRYRDYVFDCINEDLPIDRFLVEQIAGDLLDAETAEERARLTVATGFLAVGTKNLSESNRAQFEADLIDEQIDSLTRAVMGTSLACARCHDHKFDPFDMSDYYSLVGIFGSTKTFFGTYVSPASQQGGELIVLPELPEQVILHNSLPVPKVRELQEKLVELRAEKEALEQATRDAFAGREPVRKFTLTDALRIIWQLGGVEGQLQTVDHDGKALPLAMGACEAERIGDSPIYARGEIQRPGNSVPRGFPKTLLFDSEYSTISEDQSGRMELARWLTDPQHPLTSRVFVNRVWQHLFGAGLVRTVDNFGATGEKPSHPQLLDNLAIEFIEDNWSLKQLIRRLVLTRTYRQSSEFDSVAFQRDPDNRLLWRMPKRRLGAEAIRDSMLVVAGDIDLSRPQGSLVGRVILDRPISLIGLDKRLPADLDGSRHRSVYLPVIRDRLPDVLELFDFAEPSLVTGQRDTTNVPVQALYFMNSSFVRQRAERMAKTLSVEHASDRERVDSAFRLCFGRAPDSMEVEMAVEYLESERLITHQNEPSSIEATTRFCQSLLASAEFRYIE